eukprot:TRINITY_DN619_c0_g1_i8.p1 TRINITY_DN619_c0_g1~~TRINITY_DN619_c0_g1_i8.p1  ORF type:complete len:361 (-),score=22.59 TRINITY_DN619_c0_g1_i8:3-1085(-)
MDTILQWNLRGFYSNLEELQLLCREFKPSVLALQETLQRDGKTLTFSGFNFLSIPAQPKHGGVTGGVALLLHKSLLYSPIHLETPLQAVAARVTLHKTVTICSVYLPPSLPVRRQDVSNLIEQLPRPFLLLGDFNGHSPLWGSEETSARGLLLENMFSELDLCCLNDRSPTYLHPATGKLSCLDLSVCDPSSVLDYEWRVHDDLHGSDHFPLILSSSNVESDTLPQRLNLHKANWDLFQTIIRRELDEESVLNSHDPAEAFSQIILKCAKAAIPLTSNKLQMAKTPWFNPECRVINKSRKRAQRFIFRNPSADNVRAHQKLRARSKYIYKKSKRQSWRKKKFNIDSVSYTHLTLPTIYSV